MFKSRLYDLFSSNYANELLGSYVTYIYNVKLYVTMYYPIVDFFSRTAARICFEFCVDVPGVDPY